MYIKVKTQETSVTMRVSKTLLILNELKKTGNIGFPSKSTYIL